MANRTIRQQMADKGYGGALGPTSAGMGSAIPENQRMMGVANPEHVANLAAQGALQTRESIEIDAKTRAESMRIIDCIETGIERGFKPSKDLNQAAQEGIVSLQALLEEMEQWEKEKIDKEMEEENSVPEYDIAPDDPLYNPIMDTTRRSAIESKLKPLSFEDMVFQGHCDQHVPIRNNFSVTFRTLSTVQSLWVESMMLNIREQSIQYGRHWMSLVQLSISLVEINGRPVLPSIDKYTKPAHEDDFKTAVDKRMEFIGRMPQVLTDDLIIQFSWFVSRVRKVMTGDIVGKVGN